MKAYKEYHKKHYGDSGFVLLKLNEEEIEYTWIDGKTDCAVVRLVKI